METESHTEVKQEQTITKRHFCSVTPLSKYLAMALFILLPFIGFWLGLQFQSPTPVPVIEYIPPIITITELDEKQEVTIPEVESQTGTETEAPLPLIESKPEEITQELSEQPPIAPIELPEPVLEEPAEPIVPGYTADEVTSHDSPEDCWTIINDQVYDLTQFASQHEGGTEAVYSLCGIDGTEDYLSEHRRETKPEEELEKLYIGALIE